MHESEKWKWSRSVVSDSSRSHGLQPTRLLHPWDFLGKSTGVGCHCLLWNIPLPHIKLFILNPTWPREKLDIKCLHFLEHNARAGNLGSNCFRPWGEKVARRGRDHTGTMIWLKGKGCVTLWVASVVEILTSEAQPHGVRCAVYALGKQWCGLLGAESTVWYGYLSLIKSHQIWFSGPVEYWLTG